MGDPRLGAYAAVAVAGFGVVAALGCQPPAYGAEAYGFGGRGSVEDDEDALTESAAGAAATRPPRSSGKDAGAEAGADSSADAATSTATPETRSFTLGPTDCGGGRCGGGYDDARNEGAIVTASKQCVDRGFARATAFTIGGQPGGRFCTFDGTAYACDPSCDGCNEMETVTCAKP